MNFPKVMIHSSILLILFLSFSACDAFGLYGLISSAASNSSDESDDEVAFLSLVEEVSNTVNSNASDTSLSSSSTNSSDLVMGTRYLRPRFYCTDAEEIFSCDNDTGNVTRTVDFSDCEIERAFFTIQLDGSITNTITNGGDGLCNADGETINFGNMVMGRDDQNAVFENNTSPSLTHTVTGHQEYELDVTASHMITYSSPIDENEDGVAESVTATIEKEVERLRYKDNDLKHDVVVFTSEDGFTLEDGTFVATSLPVHTITISDNFVTGRLIQEGSDLIVDHKNFNVDSGKDGFRMLFTVQSGGLEFVNNQCGPYNGTVSFSQYTLHSDGTLEEATHTGTMTFSEGTLTIERDDGTTYEIEPRPDCVDSE